MRHIMRKRHNTRAQYRIGQYARIHGRSLDQVKSFRNGPHVTVTLWLSTQWDMFLATSEACRLIKDGGRGNPLLQSCFDAYLSALPQIGPCDAKTDHPN